MKIRNPKYPFKQQDGWDNCPACFEDFSLDPCTHCGSGFDDEYIEISSELETLRQRVAELEENWRLSEIASAKRQMNVIKLTAERDALKQQRDELLAALGSGGRHCNDDTPHSNLCEAIIDSKEADLGQGLDPFWKWAFRRGFHEAETSYKVDIATLEQQRDELLKAMIHIQQVACSGSPELGIATNAIASVKEKS